MIRIGIVGTGGIAHAHAEGLLGLTDRAQVTALCDVDDAALDRMAARFPQARRTKDWNELLAGDVDAVINCLPHHLHCPCIVDCARAGKHVLCEKPLCTSLNDADRIREAVEGRITLMCAHNQLFHPAVEKARAMLEEGVVGDLWTLRTVDCFELRQDAAAWGWRGKLETMGGGCLIDTGYHPSYMLMYLAQAEPETVVAMTDHHSDAALEGEDSAEVLVRFKNGVRGTILTSWAYEAPIGHWQVHATGSRGQLFGRGNILYYQPNRWSEPARIDLKERKQFQAQAAHFLDCVETGARPRHNHEDGIAVLRIILGAYESVRTSQVSKFT